MEHNPSTKHRQFTPRTRSVQEEPRSSRRLSVLLLCVAVALALAVASWLGFLHKNADNKIEIKDAKITINTEVALTGVRYRGVSSNGQPFNITADQAGEVADGSGRIDMQQPRAIIRMKNGQIYEMRSDFGVFDKTNDNVDMTGTVVVLQPIKNLKLSSEAFFADLKLGEMHSPVPVVVEDDNRRIDAETMTVFDDGERIMFVGTTRMVVK